MCMYVCMHACMHACMYACMYVCMYVYLSMYIYIYIVYVCHVGPGDRKGPPGRRPFARGTSIRNLKRIVYIYIYI